MVITGRFDHLIDDKGRLAIPSQIRNQMDPDKDGTSFYLVPKDDYLQMIPEKLFESIANQTPTGLLPSDEDAMVRRQLYSLTTKLDPDKQGRVVIPDGLMKDSETPDSLIQKKLDRAVTLVGNGDRLEIWNRNEYILHMQAARLLRTTYQKTTQSTFGTPPAAQPGIGPNN